MKGTLILLVFLLGIALGVGGTMIAPDMAGPYLPYLPPAFSVKKMETVEARRGPSAKGECTAVR